MRKSQSQSCLRNFNDREVLPAKRCPLTYCIDKSVSIESILKAAVSIQMPRIFEQTHVLLPTSLVRGSSVRMSTLKPNRARACFCCCATASKSVTCAALTDASARRHTSKRSRTLSSSCTKSDALGAHDCAHAYKRTRTLTHARTRSHARARAAQVLARATSPMRAHGFPPHAQAQMHAQVHVCACECDPWIAKSAACS
eukprot:6194371-Pleurochrysis_carterae.AAC.1